MERSHAQPDRGTPAAGYGKPARGAQPRRERNAPLGDGRRASAAVVASTPRRLSPHDCHSASALGRMSDIQARWWDSLGVAFVAATSGLFGLRYPSLTLDELSLLI